MPRKPKTTSSPRLSKSKPKSKSPDHPKYADMIIEAINHFHDRTGSSAPAIYKFIVAKFKLPDEAKAKTQLKLALKRLMDQDALLKVKASYKLADLTKDSMKKKEQEKKKK